MRPRRRPPPGSQAEAPESGTDGPAPAPQPPAVLVVDDDPRNLAAIAEVLAGLGAEIVTAASGREALRLVLRHDFCAILMDVRMPDMDGYETATLIRERERSRRIPLVFLTAYDKDQTQVFRGYTAGAVDYVFKPVEPVVLRTKISVFIELYRQRQEIRAKAEQERRLLEENLRVRSERMQAEMQLRSSERREAMVLRLLPIAVYEAAPDGQGMTRSFLHGDSVKRLLGFDAAQFADNDQFWAERVHGDDWAEVREALNGLTGGGSYSVQYRWRCADGSYRHFLDQGVLVPVGGGEGGLTIFGTMLDVHDRRMLEQQLVHAQKLDAVGKLTGGIAHDFNNMLTVVIGNLDRMQRSEGLDGRTRRRIEHALQGALHCRDITKRLLGFARQQSVAPQVLDLNALIEGLAGLATRTLGERIEVRTSLARDLGEVCVDAGQIEAAILNLLVNARDAMPEGGRVTIRTAQAHIPAPGERGGTGPRRRARGAPAGLRPGDYVVLEVADSGIGMSHEVLARACEPFFTTKAAGHGTGLGLSTIHSLAMQSGGGLGLESRPGRGTTARLFLPRHGAARREVAAETARDEQAELPLAARDELVLVVEDEDAVRRMAANTLRELGYRVVEAGNAAAALEALERAGEVHLLFTDVIMPGRANGPQLAREARLRRPGLKVLFTSAYGGDTLSEEALEPFLRKPYRDFELAHAIRAAMA